MARSNEAVLARNKRIKAKRHQRVNRSSTGNFAMFLFLFLCSCFTALPMVYAITTAFKPLDELWRFPPHIIIVNHPTMKNFMDLISVMSSSWVPFSRYIFNSFFITFIGTAGNVIFASMAAYPLAKKRFPGANGFFQIIVFSLMFTPAVTAIPSYIVMSGLGWIDSYAALIVPAFGSTLGLYLIRQFMVGVPDAMLEAAKIDGANEWLIFWRIVMPQIKPAWLTAMIFSVQALWNSSSSNFIYSEKFKSLPYAMSQIVTTGIARQGTGAAATLVLMLVPIIIFIFAQSNIVETMASSGIKE